MKMLGIVNPYAAGGRPLRRLAMLQAASHRSVHDVDWVVASSIGEARRRILAAPAIGVSGVLLVGGDGTVHAALPALSEAELPFGIVPCGRGNDFARNVGVSRRAADQTWWSDPLQTQHLDLPTVDGVAFASVACLGFDARVNQLAREGAGYFGGSLGYVLCVLKAIRRFEPFDVDVTVDEWRWTGAITLVAIANGACYGGGMRIAPQARMDDGLLDVCIVKAVSRTTLLMQFPSVFRGTHTSHPAVTLVSGRSIIVRSSGKRDLYADGEYVGHTPAKVSVEVRSLPVLIPVTPPTRKGAL